MEECLMPYGFYCLAAILSNFLPCLCCFLIPAVVGISMQNLSETQYKRSGQYGRYIAGYVPVEGQAPVAEVVVTQEPITPVATVFIESTGNNEGGGDAKSPLAPLAAPIASQPGPAPAIMYSAQPPVKNEF